MLSGANILMEPGTQVWLYGGLLNITNAAGEYLSYPTAEYTLDGYPGELTGGNAASSGAYSILRYSRIPTTSRQSHRK